MAIKLRDIWAIEKPSDYKVHFARHNRHEEPLEVWLRNPTDWKKWQEYRPARDEFNRPLIFSLMRFYHEPDVWLFGGVFRVLARREDAYEVELTKQGDCFIGCLKLRSVYRNRNARPRLEDQYDQFEVHEILRAPYTGRPFPGHENIDLSFEELETLNRTGRDDWKVALENIKGVYLITDEKSGRLYVGSACGEYGVWSRWANYLETGHGGNVELRRLAEDDGLDYCRKNFRFSLLEHHPLRVQDETVQSREAYWKRILQTRGDRGLNRN